MGRTPHTRGGPAGAGVAGAEAFGISFPSINRY
jgi:hypothetical protein